MIKETISERDLVIATSEYSLPTITKEDQDWFSTLQARVDTFCYLSFQRKL